VHANKAGSLPADTKNAEVISPGSVAALFSCGRVVNEFTAEVLSLMVQIGQYFGEPITGKSTVTPFCLTVACGPIILVFSTTCVL